MRFEHFLDIFVTLKNWLGQCLADFRFADLLFSVPVTRLKPDFLSHISLVADELLAHKKCLKNSLLPL